MRISVAFKYALREMRRSRRVLAFSVLSVALGVAALTAVRSVTQSLAASLVEEGRQIFGADLSLSSGQPLDVPVVVELTRELARLGARQADVTTFNSMLRRADTSESAGKTTTLVRVRAVSQGYPFYGSIHTLPPGSFANLEQEPSVVVDPAVLRELGISAGEKVKLGNLEATVLAAFQKEPGSPTAEFSFAPYVFVHQRFLSSTGLLQTGSRVEYQRLFALPEGQNARSLKDSYWQRALDAHVEVQTFEESAANTQRFLDQLGSFLTIVSLIVLLLGSIGIASALSALMKQKLVNAAIFRALGATPRDVFTIYVLLSLMVAALGCVLGSLVGAAIPFWLQGLLHTWSAELLPSSLTLRPSFRAAFEAALAGSAATLAFTLLPLFEIATIAPLRALRQDAGLSVSRRRRVLLLALTVFATACVLIVIAGWQLPSQAAALAFVGGVAGMAVALTGFAWLAIALSRRVGARLPTYTLRQGMANLHRPLNQTRTSIVAIGLGVTLLGTTAILTASLKRAASIEGRETLPNLFVVDVLPAQRDDVVKLMQNFGADQIDLSPMVTGRIRALNGTTIDVTHIERNAGRRSWQDRLRTREYFFSYRTQLSPAEELSEGKLWNGTPAQQEASVETELAQSLNVHLGDTLTLDIQGLPLDARVTSLRRVHWQALRPNTLVLLSPGSIESAPKTFIGSLRAPRETRYQLQAELVKHYANLSVIDVDDAAITVTQLLNRVTGMFDLVGSLCLVIGAVIVAGAVSAGRFTREREAMLLKVLGATPKQIGRILVTEYLVLAALGAVGGFLLAQVLGRFLLSRFLNAQLFMPYAELVAIVLGTIALNVGVALFTGRRITQTPPLEILRAD